MNPGDLAAAMQKAFPAAWKNTTGNDLPAASASQKAQQLALFLAIAEGLLSYLSSNQSDFITQFDLHQQGTPLGTTAYDVSNLVLNITGT